MLEITTHHFRSFIRLLTKEILLYTEMINEDTILNSKKNILNFNNDQKPICLQLGGNNPVSFGMKTSDWIINGKIIHTHYGRGSVVSYKYFNNKINEI